MAESNNDTLIETYLWQSFAETESNQLAIKKRLKTVCLFVPIFEDFIVESNQELFCSETDKNNKIATTTSLVKMFLFNVIILGDRIKWLKGPAEC